MKIIKLEQRSPAWHAWRNGGIGGSEIGVLLRYADVILAHAKKLKHELADHADEIRAQVEKIKEPKTYGKTLYSLWAERQGLLPPLVMNEHMERGVRWEDQIRAEFEREHGFFGGPECGELEQLPYARVSLDWIGYDDKGLNIIAEFKAPSWFSLVAMRKHGMPGQYICQTQYQLGISGAQYGFFYARYVEEIHDEDGTVIEGGFDKKPYVQRVERDELLIGTLLALVDFYGTVYLDGQEPPPFCKEDRVFIEKDSIDELVARDKLDRYAELELERLRLEALIKEPQAQLKAIEAEQKSLLTGVGDVLPKAGTLEIEGGFEIVRTSRKGLVDWTAAWSSEGKATEEADKFRKEITTGYKIALSKEALEAARVRVEQAEAALALAQAEQEALDAESLVETNTEEV